MDGDRNGLRVRPVTSANQTEGEPITDKTTFEWNYLFRGGYMRTDAYGQDRIYHFAGDGGAGYDAYIGQAPVHDATRPDFIVVSRGGPSIWDQLDPTRHIANALRWVGARLQDASDWLAREGVNNENETLAWLARQGAMMTSMWSSTADTAGNYAEIHRTAPQAIAAAYQRYDEMGIGWWDATVLTFNPLTGAAEAMDGVSYQAGDFGAKLDSFERWSRGIQSAVDTAAVALGGVANFRGVTHGVTSAFRNGGFTGVGGKIAQNYGRMLRGQNPVCFVAGTQVVVGLDEVESGELTSEESAGRHSAVGGAAGLAVAARPRVAYRTIAIEDLVARGGGEMGDGGGQTVVARDQHSPEAPLVERRILRTYERTAYHLQVLTLRDAEGNEQTLRVTDEHPFHRTAAASAVDSPGWTPARALAVGDQVLGGRGVLTVAANNGESYPRGVTVYNLEVELDHTYFVLAEDAAGEPVWVHNATYLSKAVEAHGAVPTGMTRPHGHHIVFKGAYSRSPTMAKTLGLSRRILDRVGIGVDDAANLMVLGNNKGVHTIANAKKVLGELYKVRNGSKQDVVDKLRKVADRWQRGKV